MIGATYGQSRYYPLSDVESGAHENLTDSYLAGAFGANPRVSEGQIGRSLLVTDGLGIASY